MNIKKLDLSLFYDFIGSCEMILINAESDIIPWQDSMIRELWEKKSFLHSKIMKSGVSLWRANDIEIIENAHKCRTTIIELVLIQQNESVKKHVRRELSTLHQKFKLFQLKFNVVFCWWLFWTPHRL